MQVKSIISKVTVPLVVALVLAGFGCEKSSGCHDDSDDKIRAQQEQSLAEANSEVGLPNVHNWFEKRLLKTILEMRDDSTLVTWTYTFAENDGALTFLCQSIGYGIPSATQYTNPQKWVGGEKGNISLPQADPNGLFSPASAEGTWVLCQNPTSDAPDAHPVYIEPRIVVSPFPLTAKTQTAEKEKTK